MTWRVIVRMVCVCVCVRLSRVDGSAVQASKSSRGTSGVGNQSRMGPKSIARFLRPKAFLHKTNAEPDPWWPRGKGPCSPSATGVLAALLCGEFDNTAQVHFTPATPNFTPSTPHAAHPFVSRLKPNDRPGSNFTLTPSTSRGSSTRGFGTPRAVNPLSPHQYTTPRSQKPPSEPRCWGLDPRRVILHPSGDRRCHIEAAAALL